MTPREKVRMHRKSEREHVRAVRYFLKHEDYTQAATRLAWALQQATAADVWETVAATEKKETLCLPRKRR